MQTKPPLSPAEFTLLLLMDDARFYNLSSLKKLFLQHALLYADILPYFFGSQTVTQMVYRLLKAGYLIRIQHTGCAMLFRLSLSAAYHCTQEEMS